MTQTNTPPQVKSWEEEFDKQFCACPACPPILHRESIKSFIQSLLDKQREELRGKVNLMIGTEIREDDDHECHIGCCGSCICEVVDELISKSDVLKLLE